MVLPAFAVGVAIISRKMFKETASDQQEFLEQAKTARRGREERKCHETASVAIQAGARGYLARTRLKNKIRKVRTRTVYLVS